MPLNRTVLVRRARHVHGLCAAPGYAIRATLATLTPSPEPPMNPKFPQPPFINELAGKLGEMLKQSPARDIEQNLKAGLTSMLGKLDMVSREEFDVQADVLAHTREKLAQLETRIAELEKQQRAEDE